ncbi:MAG: hypothetical protein BroJett021_15860 [Chloroflexota bacterium]|nr:MAG: hypothetical protein BroJett021_15860 [Chloroflexota bacterium]
MNKSMFSIAGSLTLTLALALSCMFPFQAVRAQSGSTYVCVEIESVIALHPFDGKSAADFYAKLDIGTYSLERTEIIPNRDHISPGWRKCGYLAVGQPIRVYVYDSDGRSSRDDQADLSSSKHYRALFLYLQPFGSTCQVRQDVDGGTNWWGSVSDRCDVRQWSAGTERPAASVLWHVWIP